MTMNRCGYVSVKPSPESAKAIHNFLLMAGLEGINPDDDFHVTLMYSKESSISQEAAQRLNKPDAVYKATIKGFDILGGDALVLVLESPELQERFKELSIFLKHSFDEYLPHMSIKYGATREECNEINELYKRLNFPVGTILLSNESIVPVKKPT